VAVDTDRDDDDDDDDDERDEKGVGRPPRTHGKRRRGRVNATAVVRRAESIPSELEMTVRASAPFVRDARAAWGTGRRVSCRNEGRGTRSRGVVWARRGVLT
jgi:hypothetical protein